MDYDVDIRISGGNHSGKTSVLALLNKALEEAGAEVILQRVDPTLDEKVKLESKTLNRIQGLKVFLRESMTEY